MRIEEYAKKWPKAYKRTDMENADGVYVRDALVPDWPESAPWPTEGMIAKGAIFLGQGNGKYNPWFFGWSRHEAGIEWVADEHNGCNMSYKFALDPSSQSADAIIREFRPDLVEDDRLADEPEKEIEPFWMVYVEGGSAPTVRHESYQDAEREAVRLAEKEGEPAYILRGVMAVEVTRKVLKKVVSSKL